jgi:hypothetical protein
MMIEKMFGRSAEVAGKKWLMVSPTVPAVPPTVLDHCPSFTQRHLLNVKKVIVNIPSNNYKNDTL